MSYTRPHEDRLGTGGADGRVLTYTDTGTAAWEVAAGGSGAVATDAIFDAKGDLAVGTGADTADNLTVGVNGSMVVADSATTTGLRWRKNNDAATSAPGTANDSADGYSVGSRWIDINNDTEWVCVDDTPAGANWRETAHPSLADHDMLGVATDTDLTTHAATPHGDTVFVDTPNDVAINSTTDVTVNTRDVTGVAAGDQLIVDAWFTILNNSTATRVITITLDFDGAFDVELSTGALAFSATLMQPVHLYAVLDVRSTSLAYAMFFMDMQLLAGIASGTDTTAAATHLQAKGWGTSGANLTGTVTVALLARSANATATQTLRLHSHTIRKVTPT